MDEVADLLTNYALEAGSLDNVTILVVWINWNTRQDRATLTEVPPPPSNANEFREKPRGDEEVPVAVPLNIPEDSPVLISLHGVQLRASYFYLSKAQESVCKRKLDLSFPLPCWVSRQ